MKRDDIATTIGFVAGGACTLADRSSEGLMTGIAVFILVTLLANIFIGDRRHG